MLVFIKNKYFDVNELPFWARDKYHIVATPTKNAVTQTFYEKDGVISCNSFITN